MGRNSPEALLLANVAEPQVRVSDPQGHVSEPKVRVSDP